MNFDLINTIFTFLSLIVAVLALFYGFYTQKKKENEKDTISVNSPSFTNSFNSYHTINTTQNINKIYKGRTPKKSNKSANNTSTNEESIANLVIYTIGFMAMLFIYLKYTVWIFTFIDMAILVSLTIFIFQIRSKDGISSHFVICEFILFVSMALYAFLFHYSIVASDMSVSTIQIGSFISQDLSFISLSSFIQSLTNAISNITKVYFSSTQEVQLYLLSNLLGAICIAGFTFGTYINNYMLIKCKKINSNNKDLIIHILIFHVLCIILYTNSFHRLFLLF